MAAQRVVAMVEKRAVLSDGKSVARMAAAMVDSWGVPMAAK